MPLLTSPYQIEVGHTMRGSMRSEQSVFPDPHGADPSGLVAVTDWLDVALLLEAYSRGIFPWSEHPVRWYSPDPRAVFLRELVRIPRRIGRFMRKQELRVSFDTAFDDVIAACAASHEHEGTWISEGFLRAYGELHRMG